MHFRTRTWFAISLFCLLAAVVFWQLGERAEREQALSRIGATNAVAPASVPQNNSASEKATAPAQPGNPVAAPGNPGTKTNSANAVAQDPFPHRLTNTAKSIDDLIRSEQSILLGNALIDSSGPIQLPIPPHLKSAGDPGSYIVQARGPITDAFRAQLKQAGAEVISYVPNNAYLVRASAAAAKQLESAPETQAVLSWEPYFKLDPALLALAVDQKPLPEGAPLNVLFFPGERAAAVDALAKLGIEIVSEQRSPFGHQVAIRAPAGALIALASLPGVQAVERRFERKPANDITRGRVRVATNTVTANNYLGLSGNNVLVNVNDFGVGQHPDLPRVLAASVTGTNDLNGHGTHVSGIIASTGQNGPPGSVVRGSATNANFRGMAPAASILAQNVDPVFAPLVNDAELQETAVLTNALISNNSWAYSGETRYSMASALWDSAARDAAPGVTGPQPLTMVFAAGNDGGLDSALFGIGGGRVLSPGNAKNVITVGAIENFRRITNFVTVVDQDTGDTNKSQPWLSMTDSSNRVASFSSQGNVGIGAEGMFGRFKPDVVAPGTFVLSTRPEGYVPPTAQVSYSIDDRPDELVPRGQTNQYNIFVPDNAALLAVLVWTNQASRQPFPPMLIEAGPSGSAPMFLGVYFGFTAVTPGIWTFTVANTNRFDVRCDVRAVLVLTNSSGDYFQELARVNAGPAQYHYGFESGTSQAAACVSGLAALMQEYFAARGTTNSPALTKALLINGARTLGGGYDYQVRGYFNDQGWGLVNLTNSLPQNGPVAGNDGGATGPLVYYEQDPSRALVTGQSHTRIITVPAAAKNFPLRITLVWTDPPGNPAVGVKLVNDLDLIVTEVTNVPSRVYIGNDFALGAAFTSVSPSLTNANFDYVNNVENVFIDRVLSGSYSVEVRARRVNVNSVTTQTNGVAQDYALVISSGNPAGGPISVSGQNAPFDPNPLVTVMTNGIPLLDQRVGANSPLLSGTTNGTANQWHFFVVTNQLPGTNVGSPTHIAFVTFIPPNLARARTNTADIDLYVTADPSITNLNPAAINSAFQSRGRGGTESVVIDGATPGALYYAGVKSEDQQSAVFGIFSVSSVQPFSTADEDGKINAQGYPLPAEIPDGEPAAPQAALIFAFVTQPVTIQNVVVSNTITHENLGDLLGVLEHDAKFSVLNNNDASPASGTVDWIFDDSDSGKIVASRPTSTPGTLRNFVGEEGVGVWQLTEIDGAFGFTGRVERFSITIEPKIETNGPLGVFGTILPNRWLYVPVEVPADATNLFACVSPQNGAVEVYVRRLLFPSRQNYDKFAIIIPPGDCLNLGKRDAPPLSVGRYIVGYYNPNATPLDFYHREGVDRNLRKTGRLGFRSGNAVDIPDDAITNSVIFVPRNQLVADVQVGVRIDHPRVSDLVLHVISPSGTRLLLAENRGGPDGANFGFGTLQTNVFPSTSSGQTLPDTNTLGPVGTEGTVQIDYDFFFNPDTLHVYYDGDLIFDSGLVSFDGTFAVDYGPGNDTNVIITMNEMGNRPGNAWVYTATVYSGYTYAYFSDDTNTARIPIKFAVPPFTNINYSITNVFTNGVVLEDGFEDGRSGDATVGVGGYISGWRVDSGDVDSLESHAMISPYFTAPHTGDRFIDISGFSAGVLFTNFATIPGSDYQVSFAFTRNAANPNPTTANVNAFDDTGGPVSSFGVVAPASSTGTWLTTSFVFTATSPMSRLEIQSTTFDPRGLFFDTFKVEEVSRKISSGICFQPEEPLSPFRGENAFGDWKLEVWDNRIGAVASNAVLAWKLNFAFVNTNPPVVQLTNALVYCTTLGSDETAYYLVNVPLSAMNVTNSLSAGANVDLLFNQFGLPIGTAPPDALFMRNVTNAVTIQDLGGWNTYNTNLVPPQLIGVGNQPLQPGRRYYLAVRNRSVAANEVCLRVDFDHLDPNLLEVTPIDVNTCSTNRVLSTNLLDYFQVDVPANAVEVTFTLMTAGPQLGMVANPGLPLPNPTSYFRKSDDPTNAIEVIDVVDYSGKLLPGRWYIGVYNTNTTDMGISYSLCVSIKTANVIDIGGGGSFTNTVDPFGIRYYTVNILSNACLARFCATPTNGDVDIYVAPNPPGLLPVNPIVTTNVPVFTNATLFSASNGVNMAECVELFSYSPTNPLTPGIWVIAVVNPTAATVTFRLDVTQQFNCFAEYTLLTNRVPFCAVLTNANEVDYYRFVVANSAIQAVFETFGATNDVDLYIRHGPPVPFPSPGNSDYASTNGGGTNEFICLLRNSTNLLIPGDWFIAAVNKSQTPGVSYCIRASQLTSNEVVSLNRGLDPSVRSVCTNVPPGDTNIWNSGVQFYSFNVSSNAFQATFETFGASGDVDLYLQHGLPVTNFTTYNSVSNVYPYASTNAGVARELLCLSKDSAPVPLTNGLWYLAVVNRETNNVAVNYCVRATQLQTNGLPHFSSNGGSIICATVAAASTNGSVLDGIDYYVLNIGSNTVAANIEAFNLSGDVDLYVQRSPCLVNFATLPLGPTNYPYASTNLGTNGEWICVTTNSRPVALTDGDWFIAVVNRDPTNTAVNYCLRATVIRTNDLTLLADRNGDFYRGAQRCTSPFQTPLEPPSTTNSVAGIDYYVIDVPTNAVVLELETYNATGDVDLFVQYGPCFPLVAFGTAVSNYVYSSTSRGTNNEIIWVTTNSAPVPLTNGLWYVAVVNRTTNFVNYCLRTRLLLDTDIARLSNGVTSCSTLANRVTDQAPTGHGGIDYYVFHVSSNAVQAAFEAWSTNGNVDLYVQYGPCLTNYATFRGAVTNYPYLSTNIFTNTSLAFYPYASTNLGTNAEAICLVTNSLQVPLKEGDWYLAVVNRSTNGAPVDYCVRATEVLDKQITDLTNRTPYLATVAVTNDVANVGVDYYHYRVNSNVVQVNVEVYFYQLPGGNVDLYAKKDLCWTDPLKFPYSSTNLSSNAELVILFTNAPPTPNNYGRLTAGDWYFAVVNHHMPTSRVDYFIRVTEFKTNDILPLANCTPRSSALNPASLGTLFQTGVVADFYVFNVSSNAVQAVFEILQTDLDVNLYVRRALPLPETNRFHYASENGGKSNEWILVNSNSQPAALAPGYWFLAVENTAPPNTNFIAHYVIRGYEVTTGDVTRLSNATPVSATVSGVGAPECGAGVDYYVFHVSTNAVEAAFKTFGANGNVDLYLSTNALPSQVDYLHGSENFGTMDELIPLATNNSAVPLTPGDWYLAVVNREGTPVTYSVCATEYIVGAPGSSGIVRLTNGVPFANVVSATNAVPYSGRQYYVFNVSSNAIQANFELFGLSGNVDLFVRRGLTLPDMFGADASSANGGATNELIVLTTNGLPVLAPGDWYLTVVNRETMPVNYTIRATEYTVGGTNTGGITRLLSGECRTNTIAGTNAQIRPRIDYYVFTVTNGSVRAQFEILDPNGDVNLIVSRGLPLPTLTNYAAISANPGICPELITVLSNGASGVSLTAGDWFLGVVNTNATNVAYTVCARQYTEWGTNLSISSLTITNAGSTNGQLCVTWTNVLPDVSYFVQAKPNLNVSNWVAVSGTFRAASSTDSLRWCTAYPSPYSFFRIREGLAPKLLHPQIPIIVNWSNNVTAVCWTAPTNEQFMVEWSSPLTPGSWRSFTNLVTSTNGTFKLFDDGSQTGPANPFRFYRLILLQ